MRSLFDRISKPLLLKPDATISDIRDTELRSIESELNRLLNSRSYFSGNALMSQTVLDYGLKNIVSAGTSKPGRVAEIEESVQAAIKTYEPRLLNPVVQGHYLDDQPTKLMVTVMGTLRQSKSSIQFSIPLTITSKEM